MLHGRPENRPPHCLSDYQTYFALHRNILIVLKVWFGPILLRKAFGVRRVIGIGPASFVSSGWSWDQLCELSEVLGGGCEVELTSGSVWSSEAVAIQLQDAFEMGEQHLDLLSGSHRCDIGI